MSKSTPTTTTSNASASAYLASLLNRTLRIHTNDARIFVGQMKCTDRERNIILAMTHEFRHPSALAIQDAAREHEKRGLPGTVKVDMIRRFVGLVVVPGGVIDKIEVE